jgi:chemotaxis protein CheY-P-specific phosphatase CheC
MQTFNKMVMNSQSRTEIVDQDLKNLKSMVIMGYMYASESLKRFVGTPVLSNVPKIEISDLNPRMTHRNGANPDDTLIVLSTDIIGTVSCKSYFILTPKEAEEIVKIVAENTGMSPSLGDELLKETDNILAAGVTTCFSNKMKTTIYGGVPIMHKIKASELHGFIHEEIHSLDFDVEDYDYYAVTKTNLMFTAHRDIKPSFLWVFPSEFVQQL